MKKVLFKDLSGFYSHPKGNIYFIADCVNWCEEHINKREYYIGAKPSPWDTIKHPRATFELMMPPSIGIEFKDDEDATAFLLVFK